MEEEINQSCQNCKYFVQYYAIRNGSFYTVWSGQCVNEDFKKISRKNLPYPDGCALWETDAEIKKERTEKIYSILEKTEKHLSHIKQVLKLYKE